MVIDLGRVHRPDEAKDGRGRQPQHESETDTVELNADAIEEQPTAPRPVADAEGHFDIAV